MRTALARDIDALPHLSRAATVALWTTGRMAELGLRRPAGEQAGRLYRRLAATGFRPEAWEVVAYLRAKPGADPDAAAVMAVVLGQPEAA